MGKATSQAPFILYGTPACHLCEEAQEMFLELCRAEPALAFTEVDISETDALFQRYGLRIPVVLRPDGRELGWPFSRAELAAFCTGC
jgi:hypothetical protein